MIPCRALDCTTLFYQARHSKTIGDSARAWAAARYNDCCGGGLAGADLGALPGTRELPIPRPMPAWRSLEACIQTRRKYEAGCVPWPAAPSAIRSCLGLQDYLRYYCGKDAPLEGVELDSWLSDLWDRYVRNLPAIMVPAIGAGVLANELWGRFVSTSDPEEKQAVISQVIAARQAGTLSDADFQALIKAMQGTSTGASWALWALGGAAAALGLLILAGRR